MRTIGGNLKLLRIRNNLSLKEAGKLVNMSAPGLLKYEKGLIRPSMEKLTSFAKIYNSTIDEILNVDTSTELKWTNIKFEKRVSLVKQDMVKSIIQKKVDNYFELLDKSNKKIQNKFGVHIINTLAEAESLATKLKIFFQLPIDDPIHNLIYLLERHDIVIMTLDNSNKTDGFIGFYETINNVPIIVVPKVDNGYDQRFNVAKFLGELLILSEKNKDEITTMFALSLLIPKNALISEFGDNRKKIDFNEIMIFSRIYKVGYKNIIKRLEYLNIITPSNAKYLNIDINKKLLKEEVYIEQANNYDKMLYKLYAKGAITNLNDYL